MSPKLAYRRWLQFGLGTVFVIMTVFAILSYWGLCVSRITQAKGEFRETRANYDWSVAEASDVCETSLKLYRAEIATPFSNRQRAAAEHFERVESIWNRAYGPTSEWLMGATNDQEVAAANARMLKDKAYYDDAAQMAGVATAAP
jgi:hypothetical protein